MPFQKYLMRVTILTVCLLIFSHQPVQATAEKIRVPEISADKLKQLIGQPKTVIVDVRRFRSWWRSSKKIMTAVREDPSKVEKWAHKYAADMTLIFYCS